MLTSAIFKGQVPGAGAHPGVVPTSSSVRSDQIPDRKVEFVFFASRLVLIFAYHEMYETILAELQGSLDFQVTRSDENLADLAVTTAAMETYFCRHRPGLTLKAISYRVDD